MLRRTLRRNGRIGLPVGVALVAIALPAFGADPVTVRGTVVDARTGAPVPRVAVRVDDGDGRMLALTTDARGRYAAIGLEAGDVTVSLPATYAETHVEIVCRVSSGDTARVDVRVRLPERATAAPQEVEAIEQPACTLQPRTSDVYIIR